MNVSAKRFRDKSKLIGRCRDCILKAVKSGRCLKHYKEVRRADRKKILRRQAAGVCVWCEEKLSPMSKRFCQKHREYKQNWKPTPKGEMK